MRIGAVELEINYIQTRFQRTYLLGIIAVKIFKTVNNTDLRDLIVVLVVETKELVKVLSSFDQVAWQAAFSVTVKPESGKLSRKLAR